MQEAYLRALERWPHDGAPRDEEGWLLRVAHNHLVDALRREKREVSAGEEDFEALLGEAGDAGNAGDAAPPGAGIDDELRLVFLCCHPILPRAAQIALTLRVAWGFTNAQLARAFLSDEKTVEQRVVRAKQRLRDAHVLFELPDDASRLEAVLDVLYQLFTEGHLDDEGLAAESLRLVRALCATPRFDAPEANALRALFCFHASRMPARLAEDGSPLLLHEQDRARWDVSLAAEGFEALARAARGDAISRFHAEAGIAACHAVARSHDETDWAQVVDLYDVLRICSPSPVVDVSRALAIASRDGASAGLDALDAIPERDLLARYPYALAAYAELHARLGDAGAARDYLERALANQTATAQRALLERKLAALSTRGSRT